jgi:hypothetical protein
MNGRARRQIDREQPPRSPATQHIDAFITSRRGHSRGRPLASGLGRSGSIRAHRIGQIRFITQPIAAMLPPSGWGPHRDSKWASTTPGNHASPGHSTDFGTGSETRVNIGRWLAMYPRQGISTRWSAINVALRRRRVPRHPDGINCGSASEAQWPDGQPCRHPRMAGAPCEQDHCLPRVRRTRRHT